MPRLRTRVVDNHPKIHRFLAPALTAAGYDPVRADTGRQALAEIAKKPPDAVVLDLGLPDIDGRAGRRRLAGKAVPGRRAAGPSSRHHAPAAEAQRDPAGSAGGRPRHRLAAP